MRVFADKQADEPRADATFRRPLTRSAPLRRVLRSENRTGIPDRLKAAVEDLSGCSMDDVRIHYNSAKPAQFDAVASTRGGRIELAPGQERHLAHEAWHAVQQRQGRVTSRIQSNGVSINDDRRLEREADVMGSRAMGMARRPGRRDASERVEQPMLVRSPVMQLETGLEVGAQVNVWIKGHQMVEDGTYAAEIVKVVDDGKRYEVLFKDADYNGYVTDKVFDEKVVKRLATTQKGAVHRPPPWAMPSLELSEAVKKDIARIVGEEAKTIQDLSEEQLNDLIDKLESIEGRLGLVDTLITSLKIDLEDLQKHNETPEETEERRLRIETEIQMAKDTAFKGRFGVPLQEATWDKLATSIEAWWLEMKQAEGKVEFQAAFRANRMTARQINIGSTARGGEFPVRKLGGKPNPKTDRKIFLDNTVAGIEKRADEGNLADTAAVNKAGVHDLSASLLRGDNDQGIFEQLKFYKDSVVLFMPLSEEKDVRIFSALASLQGMDQKRIDEMSGLFTRPVLAQASDMGTVFVDTQPGSEGEGMFRYGLTGTVIRQQGDRARSINKADEAARRKGALAYTEIATAAITKVNEVVMAYRKHESKLFPMYATWDGAEKKFIVVDGKGTPTGPTITNKGLLVS